MNTNKEVEWRSIIVPKKVEQINDYRLALIALAIDASVPPNANLPLQHCI